MLRNYYRPAFYSNILAYSSSYFLYSYCKIKKSRKEKKNSVWGLEHATTPFIASCATYYAVYVPHSLI